MSVRKIKDWWWIDFRHERKRYRRKSPANNRGAALAYEAKLRQLLAHDQPLVPKIEKAKPTFAQFADEWFRVDVLPNNKHSEQRSKHSTLRRQLLPFFGRMLVTEIGTVEVERFKAAKHRTGLSPKTINNYLATLGRALTCAEDWGVIPRRPRVRLLKLPPAVFDFLTPTESEALLTAAHNEYCRVAIRLALRTGLRLGELRGLPWDAVDLPNRTLLVRQAVVRHRIVTPKSNRFRSIPISDDLADALARVPHRGGFMLGRHDGSHPPSEETMRKILEQATKRAKLRRLGWHALRHSFASQLVRAGVHIRVVQELLGHSDVQVTMRYTHVEPSRLRDAVNRLVEAAKVAVEPETWASPESVGTSWAARLSFATHEIQRAQNDWALRGGPDGNRNGERDEHDEANDSESGER